MQRFSKVKKVPSFFKMASAWWKAPEEPYIFSSLNIDMSNMLAWIKSHKEQTGENITITHLCTKALAMAYRKYPQINAKIEANKVYRRNTVDFQVLVSTESGDEISGIKVKDADKMTISEIAREIREGAKAVRENRGPTYQVSKDLIGYCTIPMTRWILKIASALVNRFGINLSLFGFPDDPFGSAIISSVGMQGIESAYGPLIPVARCGLLFVITEIKEKPWVEDSKIVVRPVLKLCMTLDHRLFHGYYVSLLQKEIRYLLQNPSVLMDEEIRTPEEKCKIRVLRDNQAASASSGSQKVAAGGFSH
ncbi:MAG TPA: 2-oxo acid dehydrogenase subunit E2 [Desulfomonilia bacterium]|nr:2-oxo acid dehydrogenase subunit E2 [Desulfomonilia bacterium]